jgi:glycosyltransferase involved in cell wall biosynthesis
VKIVFVSWRDLANPNAGGSEVVIDRLIRELHKRGHSAALVCGGPVGEHGYRVEAAGGTLSQYAVAPFTARRFRSFDLLVDVSNGLPYFSPLWWRKPRLCFYHHVHGDQWHGQFPRIVADSGWFLERRVIPRVYRSTHFAAVSPSTANALEGLGVDAARIHLVHNGVDEHLLGPPSATSEEPLFVVLGRIAQNKSVGRILDAWEHVGPVVGGRLLVIGDGPQRATLEARRVRDVEFRGRVTEDEKRKLLGSAWLLLHAARHEGWGIAITEAAAQATPTLAFDADGVRDSVVHAETGYLATSAPDFERAWIALARDPHQLGAMGTAARARARTFTWERSTDEFLRAADAAIEARGRA